MMLMMMMLCEEEDGKVITKILSTIPALSLSLVAGGKRYHVAIVLVLASTIDGSLIVFFFFEANAPAIYLSNLLHNSGRIIPLPRCWYLCFCNLSRAMISVSDSSSNL